MWELLSSVGNLAVVIIAFSVLIFVHELGHFVAALIVGVRPERFFIGFDVYGLGIKKEYKGCVYGIGLLPLGGYVKLAGQSDDPRQQRNGRGRADEFYSKPLWAQAFVLIAGVMMNMLFGFAILLFMYLYGMPSIPAIVGGTLENSSAAYSGLRAGDKVLTIDGAPIANFNKLREFVALNANNAGVARIFDLVVQRGDEKLTRQMMGQANPEAAGLVMLGIEPPTTTIIGRIDETRPLGKDYAKFLRVGDEIIALDHQRIEHPHLQGHLLSETLAKNAGKILSATVMRATDNGEEKIHVELPIAGVGTYDFGYNVCVEVGGVMPNYPAAKTGLREKDKIIGIIIDGAERKILTRSQLSALIRERAYQPVNLTLQRGGEKLTVNAATFYSGGDPAVIAGTDTLLGVIVDANAKIIAVLPATANRDVLKIDDVILEVNGEKFTELGAAVAVAACKEVELIVAGREKPLSVRPQIDRENGVPLAGIMLQPLAMVYQVAPQTPAEKFLSPGDYVLEAVVSPHGKTTVYWANAQQKAQKPVTFTTPANLRFAEISTLTGTLPAVDFLVAQVRQSEPLPQALALAFGDAVDLSLTVYKLLHRLAKRDISTEAMTGPLGIIRFMSSTLKARDPLMELLKLLALISINLAIFNLLPFPVLDGGHLAFIGIEAVKGSPPSERWRELTQYFGVACLLLLMLYVSSNDIKRWVNDWRKSALIEYTE